MTAAKICGLSDEASLDAAIGHGARYIGFVFYPPSPRDVTIERAAALAARVSARVGIVGVFVDPDDDLVARAVAGARLVTVQVHGATPARVAAIRAGTGRETWAAIAVKTRADLAAAASFAGAADRLLYDAKTPPGGLPGGMGLRFDWGLLDGFRHPLPWVLSGGLDAGNVAEAIGRTGAPIVDVSSGVERAPGVKDVDKIAAFLQAAGA